MTETDKIIRFANLKTEYIIKTFARTTNKQFENYVVTAIWNRLGRYDLKPVTQQYVRLKDGRHALLDLYFPQLKIGIECDESYHLNNKDKDEERAKSVNDVLNSIEETAGFQMLRVDASRSIDDINEEIGDIVEKIRLMITDNITPWEIVEDPSAEALKKGKITVDDRLEFRTIQELCKCFGRADMPIQRSYFNIGNGYQIWCPKLAIPEGEKMKAGSATGWINLLIDDMDYIYESHPDVEKIMDMHYTQSNPRIVFAKSKSVLGIDAYRFLGIYKYLKMNKKTKTRIYERIEKEIDINAF